MKKIVILASIIVGALFVACGNSSGQQQSSDQPQTKKELFSPEEIAYNDSIKDIPMEYKLLIEEITVNNQNSAKKDTFHVEETYFATQKKMYLIAYANLTGYVMDQVSSRVRFLSLDGEHSIYIKGTVKILNSDGKDITPLIDFPDRRAKEDSLWNDRIRTIIKIGIIGTMDMYTQPIVNKGDTLVLRMNDDLLEQIPKQKS